MTKNLTARIAMFVMAAGIFGFSAVALHSAPEQKSNNAQPELTIAITTDIAPYVMKGATAGLEVDMARQLLKGYSLRFVQMPYSELQTAVREKGVDVSFGVQPTDDNVAYSANFITFVNVAISKKTDPVQIRGVADLANCPVLAWQNAYLELGSEFKALFSPKSPHRKQYQEIANQKRQIEMFWKAKDAVIVIDRAVFTALSRELGHSMSDVTSHDIFPAETDFRAAFKKESVLDQFDQRLAELCESGGYAEIYRAYKIEVPNSVCDSQGVEGSRSRHGAILRRTQHAVHGRCRSHVGPMVAWR
jgi:polar amino acid transport system substrate-binding protein